VANARADPSSELRFGGRGSRAGHRRIDKMNLAARCFGGHLLRERRIDRTAIDPKCVWPKMIQKSSGAQTCLFDRVWMSQHREQHVHFSGKFCRRISESSAWAEQGLGFGASAIEQNQ